MTSSPPHLQEESKSIGILTYHYGINYGGLLQAIALHEALRRLGWHAEVINYVPSGWHPFPFKPLWRSNFSQKKFFTMIPVGPPTVFLMKLKAQILVRKFKMFRNRTLNVSTNVHHENTLHSILNHYKTIIVGSDQVWSPSEHAKKIYFLDKYCGNKMSYAACCGRNYIEDKHRAVITNLLQNFHAISVRNQHTFDFVKNLINKDVPIVSDPTLLIDFNAYVKRKRRKKAYILAYILGEEIPGGHGSVLHTIKEKYGNIPVYAVSKPFGKYGACLWADRVFYDASPIKWLNLMANASFVYTDSYHGVLFSLKFQKPFLAYHTDKKRAPRLIDLRKRYSLENHIVSSVDEIESKNSINKIPDFRFTNLKIDEDRKKSIDFLTSTLNMFAHDSPKED